MTITQFVESIEAKPQFIKWAKTPVVLETIGDIQKHHGVAYITTPDGTNTYNVYFMVDTTTGEATWQQQDMLEPDKNTTALKNLVLKNYLKANFFAYFLLRSDLDNNWAEADVYVVSGTDLAKSTVLVYKPADNPITHKKIV